MDSQSPQKPTFLITEDGPSSNLRRRSREQRFIDYGLPPTPGTPAPARSTRSGRKRKINLFEEEDDLLLDKLPKYCPDTPNPHLSDCVGLMSPKAGYFDYDSSADKRRSTATLQATKRLLQMAEEGAQDGEKKKMSFDMLTDPYYSEGGNASPLMCIDDYCFNGLMDSLTSEPFSSSTTTHHTADHNNTTDDNESLNTPHVSPANTPLLSPMSSQPPMTPQTPMTPGGGDYYTPRTPRKRRSERIVPEEPKEKQQKETRATNHQVALIRNPTVHPPIDRERFHQLSRRHMRDGGLIELKVTNFMKYKTESWVWNPHMNVIIGENGSGKSAMQSSIMLGLGAKSSSTNRIESLRKFINYDHTKATIEITLTNYNGTLSKKKFGKTLSISRTITKSGGGSNMMIKHRNGQWVKIHKKELDLILKALQIHLANPLQILTQKTATAFLQNCEPGQLYKSFCDVLLITPSREFLDQSEANIKECELMLQEKQAAQLDYVKKAKELAEQYNQILEMESFKARCAELMNEFCWAQVKENEQCLRDFREKLDTLDRDIAAVKSEKKAAKEAMEKIKSAHKTEKSGLNELEKELEGLEGQHEEARHAVRAVTKEDKAIQGNIKLARDYIRKLKVEQRELQSKLEDSIASKANMDERKRQETEKEIKTYNDNIEQSSRQLHELKRKKSDLEAQEEHSIRAEDEQKSHYKILQSQLRDRQKEVKKIKQAQSTQYDRFGPQMKTLLQRLQQTKWQSRIPIGPLGACLIVKDEEYAPVLEHMLWNSLKTFVVENAGDLQILRQLIKDVYGGKQKDLPTVLCLDAIDKSGCWWERGKALIDGYPTVLDVLDIKDPSVTHALIEKDQIEKVLLFKTNQEACTILKDSNKTPKNCAYGLTNEFYKVSPFPNFSANALKIRTKTILIQTTKFDNVSQVESDIKKLEDEITQVSKYWKSAQQNTASIKKLIKSCDSELKSKSDEINRLKSELRTLEQSIAKTPDVASHNDLIEDRREWILGKLVDQESELDAEIQRKEKNELIFQKRNHELQQLNAKIGGLKERIKACSDEAGAFQQECEEVDKTIKKYEATIKTLTGHRKDLQKEFETSRKLLTQKLKKATKSGDRIESERSPDEIKSDYDGRKACYDKNLDKIKNKDRVRRERNNAETMAKVMSRQISLVKDVIQIVTMMIKVQREHLETTKEQFGLSLQNYYQVFIKRRGYTGQVVFCPEEEKLLYYVSKDASADARALSNIQTNLEDGSVSFVDWKALKDYIMTLSGGEKSYSNLSFMVALRQIMPSPFFMMDEFDVFMDAGNRKAGTDILVEQAQSQRDTQFFVFTPHEMLGLIIEDPIISLYRVYKTD